MLSIIDYITGAIFGVILLCRYYDADVVWGGQLAASSAVISCMSFVSLRARREYFF